MGRETEGYINSANTNDKPEPYVTLDIPDSQV